MKITKVKATAVNVPFKAGIRWSWGVRYETTRLVVQIETDEGITGIGETMGRVGAAAVEYEANGRWIEAAAGVWKQPEGEAIFCRFIPLARDFAETVGTVRITASGLGGIGIDHAEIRAGGKRHVPAAVSAVTGEVRDPEYLLENNTTFAWFGGQSTRRDYFDRAAAERKHSVTLAMRDSAVGGTAANRFEA